MREVLGALADAGRAGERCALATVVGVDGSSPRSLATSLLVREDGSVVGNISAGCVESEVVATALDALADPAPSPPALLVFGSDDVDDLTTSLVCGGSITVLVDVLGPAELAERAELAAAVAAGRPAAVATVVAHPHGEVLGRRAVVVPGPAVGRATGTDGTDPRRAGAVDVDTVLPDALGGVARAQLAQGGTALVDVPGGARVLVEVMLPAPRMVVAGASDVAAATAGVARLAGFHVTVVDPRAAFLTADRVPDAHELVVGWPHRYLAQEAAAGRVDARTALVVLSHDEKVDVPLLETALALPLGYVGALGSRRTQAVRRDALLARGVPADDVARVRGPVGLDLGGREPVETALSVVAEVVAVRNGRAGGSLSAPAAADRGIHPGPALAPAHLPGHQPGQARPEQPRAAAPSCDHGGTPSRRPARAPATSPA